jgi:glyoxylase-like metal-dependent hydrolase (beta-lactamase superfamily II)
VSSSGSSAPDRGEQGSHRAYMCVTCGTQYPPSERAPEHCPICEDDRQYIGPNGQRWTTLDEMRGHYHNRFYALEPGLTGMVTEPHFAIGQRAFLLETPNGNVLWEALSYVDETTIAEIERLGGAKAIAISHCHYYSSMNDWSRMLGDIPIYIHSDDRAWVMQPGPNVVFLEGETHELLPGVTIVRCGGHFPGGQVLHWADGKEGRGVLLSGDIMQVVADTRWVTFMYSYPNQIPLDPGTVRRIVAAVEPFRFERVYGAFGRNVMEDGKEAIRRSAERYIAHLTSPATDRLRPDQ